MRVRRRAVGLVVVVAVGLVGAASVALAQSSTPTATSLTLSVEPPPAADLSWRVGVLLADVDGTPVNGASVSVYVAFELVGDRRALIGSASTNATGMAYVPFTPRQSAYDLVGEFVGDEDHGPVTAQQSLLFPDAAVQPHEHVHGLHQLLGPARDVMPRAITVAVALLWIGLLSMGWSTVRDIRTDKT